MRKVKTIAFETEAKRLYLLAKEILYIQAEGHNCHVYTISGNCYIIRLTMAQCAQLIDESTYFTSSEFVLLGRNLIINYSRLGRCVFNDAEIPLRKGLMKNGQEEVVKVKCQNRAWKIFLDLLEQGEPALMQYQADKRQEYQSVNKPSSCSLIGLMTTASATKLDFYELRSKEDFLLLGGYNLTPMYSEGNMNSVPEELTDWANKTVAFINTTIRRQPTKLVDRAFKVNGEPEFDIVLSYEEYCTTSPIAKPSERLKALQKKFNESYEANLQKIISDSEKKKDDEKKGNESFENLGMYDYSRDMNRISRELSEHGDHPSCYRSRPLGQYRYKGRNRRPEIVLFMKNIYDAERDWHRGYYDKRLPTLNELVTLTYIHELMHAIMRSPTSYACIEEPLAEMGMLCFVHDALRNVKFEEKAKHWVKQKQAEEPICHYGFGAFLYDSLYDAETGWGVGNLMKQYIRVNKKLSEEETALDDYEEYFLGGYPWHNLQRSALNKLFVVLGMTHIKKIIPESKKTLFEWQKKKQPQPTAPQPRDYEEEPDDIDPVFPCRLVNVFIYNIEDHEIDLGLNSIDSNSGTFERNSSRYCQDIYIDYLRKKLNDAKFREDIFCGAQSILLTRTTQGDYCQYKLEIDN